MLCWTIHMIGKRLEHGGHEMVSEGGISIWMEMLPLIEISVSLVASRRVDLTHQHMLFKKWSMLMVKWLAYLISVHIDWQKWIICLNCVLQSLKRDSFFVRPLQLFCLLNWFWASCFVFFPAAPCSSFPLAHCGDTSVAKLYKLWRMNFFRGTKLNISLIPYCST